MADSRRGEVVQSNLKTKVIYKYVDSRLGIEVKCREVYKSGGKEVHFPFNKRNGVPRYNSIQTITYEGLPPILPAGFLKKASTGLGFTRELSPILYSLQKEIPTINHIVVSYSCHILFILHASGKE